MLTEEKLKECWEKLSQTGLPNLWLPKASDFFHVDRLPQLGTGKLDLQKIRHLALQFSANSTTGGDNLHMPC